MRPAGVCLSVRLSVPSIDSSSDVWLVLLLGSGAGGRYRSIAAGAAYLLTSTLDDAAITRI